jgi:hypothetical protein
MLKLGERQGSLSFGAASECRSEVRRAGDVRDRSQLLQCQCISS